MNIEHPRRSFVIGSLAIAATMTLGGCGGDDAGSSSLPIGDTSAAPVVPLVQGEIDIWTPLVGSSFLISAETARITATLTAVKPGGTDANRPSTLGRHQPFEAVFELEQGYQFTGGRTYQLSHGSKGIFDLFLGQPSNVGGKVLALAVLN